MKPFLTHKRAIERASKIKPGIVNYLSISLQKGEEFSGVGIYIFELMSVSGVFMDYSGKGIKQITVNGIGLTPDQIKQIWVNGSINLPHEHLKIGKNRVSIYFFNVYYHDGNGIHSFKDADDKQYVYCQSEPYWNNKIYPLFDQPDLKGYMNFTFETPSDWVVISNTNLVKSMPLSEYLAQLEVWTEIEEAVLLCRWTHMKEVPKNTIWHQFAQTPLLASYLYTFIAGPFMSVSYDGSDGPSVPMTIYCRESLFEFAKKQKTDIFLFCRRGILFYEEFFRHKYPFEKYDFVFCPEFTVGAMEYPGAITFNDQMIYREDPTSYQVTKRGMVILHELAHMWFGDLVTMKWWNDLWLNESFADFCCYLAMSFINQTLPFPVSDGWPMFQLRKFQGYDEDSEITTHPIAAEVDSTDKADSIFDGITYSKGASVLKQLYFLISHDKFSECLGNYFKKYQWKNATLQDLLEEIKKVVPQKQEGPYDIDNWNKTWIEKAGLTTLSVDWDQTKLGKSLLTITQKPYLNEYNTLRYHKLNVAFFKSDGSVICKEGIIVNNTEKTVLEFENQGYVAVLLNHGDWAFVKTILDKESRNYLCAHLSELDSKAPLSKLMVIRSMFDAVRDAELSASDFVNMILSNQFLGSVLDNSFMFEAVCNLMNEAVSLFTPENQIAETSDLIFNYLLKFAMKPQSQDLLKVIKANLLSFARSYQSVLILKDILEKTDSILEKIDLSIDDQWLVTFKVHTMKEFSDQQKRILRDYLAFNDKSDSKKYWLMTIFGFLADEQTAQSLWNQLASKERTISYIDMKAIFRGLNSNARPIELRRKFHDIFFEQALNLMLTDQKINASTFFEEGFPKTFEFDYLIKNTKKINEKLTKENEFFQIATLKKIVGLERRKKAIAIFN